MGSSLSQQKAVDEITHWRSKPTHELLFDSSRRELYIQAVDKLQESPHTNAELISTALARLKLEFQAVLSRQADHQAGSTTTTEWSTVNDSTAYVIRYEDYVVGEEPSKEVVFFLRTICERMKISGNLRECVDLYKNVRRGSLELQLRKLRFEEMSSVGSSNSKRFVWDELRVKIELWVQNVKICFKILFEREKRFCGLVFSGVGSGGERDECFLGVVRDFAVSLLGFAEGVCLSNQSYDRMEVVLGMYDAFVSVLPNVEALFGCQQGKGIVNVCAEMLARIESEVERMLRDLQKAVLCEIPGVVDDRGAVNQSTIYVMDKVDHIVGRRRLLTGLIKSTPSLNFDGTIIPEEDLGESRGDRSFLDLHLILIIVVLQRNLESKSKQHKDPSLGNLFMMNNVCYIVRKVEKNNVLREMIGESFLKKLKENVELARSRYQESTRNKFLTCLQDEGLYVTTCFKPRLSKTTFRKRLKTFNSVFEEIQLLHSSWTVPDLQLREEIRVSMATQLVPEYHNFLEKFTSNPEIKSFDKKNIKYSAQEFQDLILEKLFVNTDVKC